MTLFVSKISYYNFIRIVIFVIYYKREKKVDSKYLCHLTFILFKFNIKNFLFLEIM